MATNLDSFFDDYLESAEDAIEEQAKALMYKKYTATRVDRAFKRSVTLVSPNSYIVEGKPSLGDSYPSYLVTYDSLKNLYHCACHGSKGGEYRTQGRYLCTHAIAVDYHRTLTEWQKNAATLQIVAEEEKRIRKQKEQEKQREKQLQLEQERKCQEREKLTVERQAMIEKVKAQFGIHLPEIASNFNVSASDLGMPRKRSLPQNPPPFSDHEFWGEISMPSKFKTLRPHQWIAIKEAYDALYEPGVKAVFIDAPTGSGKTLIGECLRRIMQTKAIYLCTTKTLQTQFTNDFPYAKVLKGRSNYPTQNYPDKFRPGDNDPFSDSITCADCAKKKVYISCEDAGCTYPGCDGEHWRWECPLCDDVYMCAYELAKSEALLAPLAVLNSAYFLTEANGPARFGENDLVILDEADNIERSLMSYVEINLSPTLRKEIGLELPPKKTVSESWAQWIEEEAEPRLENAIDAARTKFKEASDQEKIKIRRWIKRLEGLHDQLKSTDVADGNWVYTGYAKQSDPDKISVNFKPIAVAEYGVPFLWNHSKKWVCMSATFIDPYAFGEDLGLTVDQIRVVRVPNTFEAKRRPVYVIPRADMSYKTKATDMPNMVKAVEDVMCAYPTDRILVHSVSYDLTRNLLTSIKSDRIMTYTSSFNREPTLDKFRSKPGAVLIAPSLDRGVDLPGDECRVVVIAKIPFPDLSDKQTNARLYSKGGSRWYASQTVRTICQMTGRAMRSKDDSCDIYILDKQFLSNLWYKNRYLFPKWWIEAVIMSGSPKVKF